MDIRLKPGVFILLFICLCGITFPAGRSVYYTSDSINVEFDRAGEPEKLLLSGNVKILLDDITIICGNAVFDRASGEVTAQDNIKIESPQGFFTSERLSYNIYEGKGLLFNSSFSAPPLYGKAGKIERDKKTLFLHNGYITTCDRENPHYRFSVDRIEYVHGDYLRAEKMRLVFGNKFSVFYFPRITIDYKTKEPPLLMSSGHSTRIGDTVDLVFQHRISKDSDTILKEKISLGTKAFGVGPELKSADNNLNIAAFFARRWDEGDIEYGGWIENVSSSRRAGNFTVDWRWMYDMDFFYDFFRDVYSEKNKTYNHASFTRNFGSGILNIGLRDNANDNFLNLEKIPEIRFYTPSFRLSEHPFFIENDLVITNFYKEGEYHLRSMDKVSVTTRSSVGNLLFAPYVSFSAVDYRNSADSKLNFAGEGGTSVSLLLKSERGNLTGYFKPSLSVFHRELRYGKEKLEYFDMIEKMNEGTFAELGIDWTLKFENRYMGNFKFENLYDIGRNSLEETSLKYDMRITENLRVAGENEWNEGGRRYSFGVNDIIFNSEKYQYSVGTRYDEQGDVSGISTGFSHNVNDVWRYAVKFYYNAEESSFDRQSMEIWKKLHCWELNIKITRDDRDFSFYIIAYPIFL
ncbi:MAG TPA: hypothetical protein PKN36_02995 [bacterium]|nr:hypothetical protein [bacterium]